MAAQAEGKAAFGNPDLFMEKYIESARHVEVQVIGDKYGNVCHVGERDCSIQRRHQKLVEEAPCPIDDEERALGDAAVKAASAVSYDSAGTLEFLYDEIEKQFLFYGNEY